MGLSFLIDKDTDNLEVMVRWGDYEYNEVKEEAKSGDSDEPSPDGDEDDGGPKAFW